MSDTHKAIEGMWKIESTRLIAGIARVTRDVGMAEELAQDALVLLSGILPDDFDPSSMDEATVQNINALNDELEAAGARDFAGGLSAPKLAKSLRLQPNGEGLITEPCFVAPPGPD